MDGKNLLTALYKWSSGQDENFITEILVYLLNHYLSNEDVASKSIFSRITGGRLKPNAAEFDALSVTTQTHTKKGIPDVKIENNHFLCFIEVKVDSHFGNNQLSRYRSILNASDKSTALISLTRYPYDQHGADIAPDHAFRWHEIADWLKALDLKSTISIFLTNEYIDFLEHRGLSMNHVNWQLTEGVRALKNVVDMLGEAISSCGIEICSKSGAWQWMGYYIESKRFFVGIYYDNPEQITLNTEVGLIDERPSEPEIGFYKDGGWQNTLELCSEEVHFFSRTRASQLACLEEFLRNSVEFGRKVIKT